MGIFRIWRRGQSLISIRAVLENWRDEEFFITFNLVFFFASFIHPFLLSLVFLMGFSAFLLLLLHCLLIPLWFDCYLWTKIFFNTFMIPFFFTQFFFFRFYLRTTLATFFFNLRSILTIFFCNKKLFTERDQTCTEKFTLNEILGVSKY